MVLYLYKRCVCQRMWWKVIWLEEGGEGGKERLCGQSQGG